MGPQPYGSMMMSFIKNDDKLQLEHLDYLDLLTNGNGFSPPLLPLLLEKISFCGLKKPQAMPMFICNPRQ